MAQDVNNRKLPSGLTRDKSWTLFFIGDHGKVITVKYFKGLAVTAVSVLLLAILAAVGLYYLYQAKSLENRTLVAALNSSKSKMRELRDQKDILMSRITVAEANSQVNAKTFEVKKNKPQKTAVKAPEPAVAAVPEVKPTPKKPKLSASVENLKVRYEADRKTYRTQFKLRNTSTASGALAGRIVVILNGNELPPNEWLTVPTVELTNGKPSGRKKGQYFKINNFKTVKFHVVSYRDPEEFNQATVLVYSEKGDLILEKNHDVTINVIKPKPKPKPTAQQVKPTPAPPKPVAEKPVVPSPANKGAAAQVDTVNGQAETEQIATGNNLEGPAESRPTLPAEDQPASTPPAEDDTVEEQTTSGQQTTNSSQTNQSR